MIQKKKKNYYKVVLSGGDEITIDENELKIISRAIDTGQKIIKCRQGIFNVSYLVEIVFDYEIESRIDSEIENFGYYDDRWFEPGEESLDKILGPTQDNKKLGDGK